MASFFMRTFVEVRSNDDEHCDEWENNVLHAP